MLKLYRVKCRGKYRYGSDHDFIASFSDNSVQLVRFRPGASARG
jgi:hypothetical protein